MRNVLVVITLFICIFACQRKDIVQKDKTKLKLTKEKFVSNDSGGVFTGLIIKWDEPSVIVPYQGLWLTDCDNDTIIFYVYPEETKNINNAKMVNGNLITVTYETEVALQQKVEVNRFYHVKKLDYP